MTVPPMHRDGTLLLHLVWCWITAVISTNDHGVATLVVLASIRVQDDDELNDPVNDYLSARCHTLDSMVEYDDPGLMGGRGLSTAFTAWPACPGTAPHACVGAA